MNDSQPSSKFSLPCTYVLLVSHKSEQIIFFENCTNLKSFMNDAGTESKFTCTNFFFKVLSKLLFKK